MIKIKESLPTYFKDMVVDYISLNDFHDDRILSFSHSTNYSKENRIYYTHYNLVYDDKNKPMKIKLSWGESLATLIPLLMSRV